MKTNSKFLLAGLAASFILGSCAKEKNSLDKNLVKSEWKLKNMEQISREYQETNYVDATPDELEIEKDSSSMAGNIQTRVSYNSTTITGMPTVWDRTTRTSEVSQTFTFAEGGTGTLKGSNRDISELNEYSALPSNNTNFTDPASLSESTIFWSWGNTDEVKTMFNLGTSLGGTMTFKVEELTKTDFILVFEANNSNTYQPNSNTTVKDISFSKFRIHLTK